MQVRSASDATRNVMSKVPTMGFVAPTKEDKKKSKQMVQLALDVEIRECESIGKLSGKPHRDYSVHFCDRKSDDSEQKMLDLELTIDSPSWAPLTRQFSPVQTPGSPGSAEMQ